jgi:hypothetical protein
MFFLVFDAVIFVVVTFSHFLTEVQLQKKDLCFGTGIENKIGTLCLQKPNLLNASTYWFGFLGV